MHGVLRDLRFGLRMLVANPGFSLAAILTLALGIGANTAMFTVVSAVLLRPFPYRAPQELVVLDSQDPARNFSATLMRYELLRDHSQSFSSVITWTNDNLNVTGHGEPLQVPVARVSANFFATLGVEPQLGRTFTAQEGRPEGPPVVMISDAFWHSRLGGDRNVLGQTITLDATPNTIVGVLPGNVEFPFVGPAEIWTPRYFEHSLVATPRLRLGVGYLVIAARMRPGVTPARADAELEVLSREYRKEVPAAADSDPALVVITRPLRDFVVAGVRGKVLMLAGAVGLVLLIACANVASLLLSRALARRRELAVRTALGASRGTLARQLLTECMLLAAVAGLLGAGLGWVAIRAWAKWAADQLPQGISVAMDLRALLFTMAVTLLTGIVFGTVPAWQLSRVDLNTTLRDEGRGSSAGRARMRANSLLVVGQVALSLLLLIGSGLLLRSFARLLRADPGFDPENVLTMNVSLPTVKYATPEQKIAFFDEMLRRVTALPGVRGAAMSAALPLSFTRTTPVLPEGQPEVPLPQRPFVDIEAVSPQWFQTMRVPLRAGRDFTAADNAQAPKVVIVNETFARRYWRDQNAVGKHVVVGHWPQPAEVVGVAADVRNRGLAQDSQAQLYLSFPQLPWGNMNLLVHSAVAPASMAPAVRAQISAIDPDQPVTKVQTVNELMASSLAQPRFTMLLLGAFAAAALGLAVIGIYGVLAYSVAQRRQELGIRLALGAERGDILRLVLRQGFLLAIVGVGAGLIAALLLTRMISALLYKIGARDPATFVLAPLLFLAVAVLASYLPARRATRVDPMETLRES